MGVRLPRRHHDNLQHRRERGCAGCLSASDCRSASRLSNAGTFRYFDLGLRVVCELD